MNDDFPQHPARRTMLAQTLAHSAALAVGSLLGGEALAAPAPPMRRPARRPTHRAAGMPETARARSTC
nr:hypothetical protein [Burkholderia territorii]